MSQNELPRNTHITQRLLRLPSVEEITGVKKSTVYALMKAEQFPAPVKLSARAVAWRSEDIMAWVASRVSVNGQAH
jgi:prophage regulatory protein